MNIKRLVLGDLRTNTYIVTKDNKCLIIDPASNYEIIVDACKNYKVDGILVTHNNSFNYEVIKTPGHTSDSLTFYFEKDKIMFTGDFIFYHTCGRCDLETSNVNDMINSLNEFKHYDDDITIYPGHGRDTVLGEEKKYFDLYFN